MLIEKVGQMLIDLMTVFGQRLLGLHSFRYSTILRTLPAMMTMPRFWESPMRNFIIILIPTSGMPPPCLICPFPMFMKK